MHQSSEVPLSLFQKGRLLFECIPFLFLFASLIFIVTLLDDITGAAPPPMLPIFIAFVTLYTGYVAFQRVRDVLSGTAVVREDRLKRLWRSRGSAPGHCYGNFEELGTLRMWPKDFVRSSNGARYRVTYSPNSKIVWSLEKMRY